MGKSKKSLRRAAYKLLPKNNLTIFIPLTRADRVQAMAEQLAKLDSPVVARVLVIIDTDKISEDTVRRSFEGHAVPFEVDVYSTGEKEPPGFGTMTRRTRIANTFTLAQQKILPEFRDGYVFVLEDDSNIEPHYLNALLANFGTLTLQAQVKVGIMSGLQAGRWGLKMIGAWKVDSPAEPTRAWTIPFSRESIFDEVDATGFYCMLTRAEMFCKAQFRWNGEAYGPDVIYGLDCRNAGYRNFVDWTLLVPHVADKGVITVDEECQQVKYELRDGKWQLDHFDTPKGI